MDKRLEKKFDDESLREVPSDPKGLRQYTDELVQSLASVTDPKKQVSILGELGVHLRSLEDLDRAQEVLLEALNIIKDHQLGIKREIQQKIRLGHVLQWKKSFTESDALFDEVVSACRTSGDLGEYIAFALQHAGKNFFDQGRFAEALSYFEEAMTIRLTQKAPQDQIDSTLLAIERTKALLGK